jgi:hypothetical protein
MKLNNYVIFISVVYGFLRSMGFNGGYGGCVTLH